VADLRGKDPHRRAELIVEACAHPAYRDALRLYIRLAQQGHEVLNLEAAFSWHRRYAERGSMES
jgi:acyl-CoA hydrolase